MTPAPERPDTERGRLLYDWLDWARDKFAGVPQSEDVLLIERQARAPAPDAGLREALTVERLAEAIILGYYEGQAEPWEQNLGNGFEWYGSALEMAQAILNGLSRQAEKETA